ncbi:hypothetical protein DES53_11718 [Roseimicrobium gellanilyticum]|uniref:MoxR-vWA-beta-propeller ternary system domain-containing protein n=1 Tax=Roseimicrobium gellanilyticum TaxID=748857 RepID=A0A366H309_9BACT|nr:hypothetical protein [Roseimicrobium gellanilyticum]RBP36329.1 hypothetical protein DES53_11718 [Roseimicrobium gellanilyticum]
MSPVYDRILVAMLSANDAAWLGRWRTLPGFEVCEAEGYLWVRGGAHHGNWKLVPALERFTADTNGRLTREGERVPVRRMPEAHWLALSDFLKVRPPASALPAQSVAPLPWALVPSREFREPALLTLSFPRFRDWVLSAPAVRLKSLQFAKSDDGRACVRGAVLPSLPGVLWYIENGVAMPAGWELPRGITPALVAVSLKLSSTALALVYEDASVEVLTDEAFVEASRSALRYSTQSSDAF